MKSIIQTEKKCFITNSTSDLHEHHIFGGANRKLSEKYGLKIYLRADWHNMSNYGVHFNKALEIELKQMAQKKFIEKYPNLDFVQIFGKNYL